MQLFKATPYAYTLELCYLPGIHKVMSDEYN